MEDVTLERLYREIKLLRKDMSDLKKLLVPEVEPEQDEVLAVKAGRREFKAKQYVEWSDVKKQT
jgi:hypothetical protein